MASIAILFARPAHAQFPVQPVMIRGDAAPGTSESFSLFSGDPFINAGGEVGFGSSLTGSLAEDHGIWSGRRNSLQLLGREGHTAPDTGGLNHSTFHVRGIADTGDAVFQGTVIWESGIDQFNDEWVWYGSSGDVGAVVHEGDPLPSPLTVFTSVPPVLSDPQGRIGYARGGVYFGESGSLQPVLQPYDSADGSGDDQFYLASIESMNDHGQFLVKGTVFDPEVVPPGSSGGRGLWLVDAASPGNSVKVARGRLTGDEGLQPGDIAPGTTAEFHNIGEASMNNNGRLAFFSELISPTNASGMWTGTPGALQLLIRQGDSLPSPYESLTVESMDFEVPIINGQDEVFFAAELAGPGVDGTNDRALLLGESYADLRFIAREGDHAPGTPDGVVFEKFSRYANGDSTPPTFNHRGQMAFYGVLTGSGVDETNDVGIWATLPGGKLAPVAREGDILELEPGVTGTISELSMSVFSNGEDGYGSSFNDRGRLVYGVKLLDPSVYQQDFAIVIAHIVPEPASWVLSLSALVALLPLARSRDWRHKRST